MNKVICDAGLQPNTSKPHVVSKGARKIILGLNVDGNSVMLGKEFKQNMRMHFYYLLHPDVGPVEHAKQRKFSSVYGLRNHIEGLVNYAESIELSYGEKIRRLLNQVSWPI